MATSKALRSLRSLVVERSRLLATFPSFHRVCSSAFSSSIAYQALGPCLYLQYVVGGAGFATINSKVSVRSATIPLTTTTSSTSGKGGKLCAYIHMNVCSEIQVCYQPSRANIPPFLACSLPTIRRKPTPRGGYMRQQGCDRLRPVFLVGAAP